MLRNDEDAFATVRACVDERCDRAIAHLRRPARGALLAREALALRFVALRRLFDDAEASDGLPFVPVVTVRD